MQHHQRILRLLLLSILLLLNVQITSAWSQDNKKVRVVLAGDSTVTDDSGWGKGFAELLNSSAECINLAKGGRSSRSYRTEGWWEKCLDAKPDYLLIQFGHNDQPGKGPERESDAKTAFRDHLRAYVNEARMASIQPVLVTSLTRRRWTRDEKVEPTLAEYAEATLVVAKEMNVPVIDLHKLSIQQCEAIGPTAFRDFEPMSEKGADHTHLNIEGSRAVAPLVARAFIDVAPQVAGLFNQEKIDAYTVPKFRPNKLTSGVLQLDETSETIVIRSANRHILTYNKVSPPVPEGMNPAYQRSGFLHPVSTPSGAVVTATFPFDHAHQHGIFSAWVKTKWLDREIDFWNLAKGSGRVLHQQVQRKFVQGDGSVEFEVDLIHRSESDPVVDILRERWTITVRETQGDHFQFDLTTTQTALTDKPLLIEKYHYGGVGYRGPVAWLSPKDQGEAKGETEKLKLEPFEFQNDRGEDRIQGNAQHTRWVVATGLIDQKPVSIIVLSHGDNFRAPQAVRLHPTKPYFVFSPCIDDSFSIDSKHPYTARYRYLISDRKPELEWIKTQWEAWQKE